MTPGTASRLLVVVQFSSQRPRRAVRQDCSFAKKQLVVIDSRAGRQLMPGQRELIRDEEWNWIREQASRPARHLLLASSVPFLLAPGVHHRALAGTREALEAYFAGADVPVPVDLSLVAAPFRGAVLETMHDSVARGEVVTYGARARRAGNERAHRAATTACGRNPVPILVPCHRVVPVGGGIGNYGGGPEHKRALLELEGALAYSPLRNAQRTASGSMPRL
jgi:O-6-methylguanine DNA methyltransferase